MSDYNGARFTEYDDGTGRWIDSSSGKTFQGYVASTKIDVDADYDDLLDQNYNDKGSSSYKKQRERKQIDDAFGKDRAKREKDSRDLHDSKNGDRNDNNKAYGDLKSGDFWIKPLKVDQWLFWV